jgi:hypothetical protein
MRKLQLIAAMLVTFASSSQAFATQTLSGTLSSVALFNPTVTFLGSTNSFSAAGSTANTAGTGDFAAAGGSFGNLTGTLDFSSTVGATLMQSLTNFFEFNDASGTIFDYSVASVRTDALDTGSGASSGSLHILGSITDSHQNLATPAVMTLQFNQTGNSAFSSPFTLSASASGVPEPITWVMTISGMGLIGAVMRQKKASLRVVVTA